MFTVRFSRGFVRGFVRPLAGHTPPADASPGRVLLACGILRMIPLLGALALGLPQTSSAQAVGTMQATARVVPASVAWAAMAEGREAAHRAAGERPGRYVLSRGGLLLTRAEIRPFGGRRLLIVTVHHPHN
jgi:hypothetical protein